MELLLGLMEEEIRVIIAEQQDQVFIIEDGEIVFIENAVANVLSISNFNRKVPFSELKLWMVVPVAGLEVLVLNTITVYFQDFLIQGYFYAKPMPVAEFAEKYIEA